MSNAAGKAVISFEGAELLEADAVPDLGEFYDATQGQRLAVLKLCGTSTLNTTGKVNSASNRVRGLQLWERSSTQFTATSDGLDIAADAELHMMEGKLNLAANFSWLKKSEGKEDVIRIVKGARIITHRRTVNREDVRSLVESNEFVSGQSMGNTAFDSVLDFAKAKKATHLCTEVIYGHFVTMTLTFKSATTTASSDMNAGGKGDISLASFKGALSGNVNIVSLKDTASLAFTVAFTCSDAFQNIVLSDDLQGKQLYQEATEAFNNVVKALCAKSASEPNQSDMAVALGFSYTPIEFLRESGKFAAVGAAERKRKQQAALATYANIQSAIRNLGTLSTHPDMHFSPRLQREVEFRLQGAEKLRATIQGDLVNAAESARKGDVTKMDVLATTYQGPVREFTRLFDSFPELPDRVNVVRRRVLELTSGNVMFVGFVSDLHNVSNTTASRPAIVALIKQWDGTETVALCEMPSPAPVANGATTTSTPHAPEWTMVAVDQPGRVLVEDCAVVNTVVALAKTHRDVTCAVLDRLSFYDNGVAPDIARGTTATVSGTGSAPPAAATVSGTGAEPVAATMKCFDRGVRQDITNVFEPERRRYVRGLQWVPITPSAVEVKLLPMLRPALSDQPFTPVPATASTNGNQINHLCCFDAPAAPSLTLIAASVLRQGGPSVDKLADFKSGFESGGKFPENAIADATREVLVVAFVVTRAGTAPASVPPANVPTTSTMFVRELKQAELKDWRVAKDAITTPATLLGTLPVFALRPVWTHHACNAATGFSLAAGVESVQRCDPVLRYALESVNAWRKGVVSPSSFSPLAAESVYGLITQSDVERAQPMVEVCLRPRTATIPVEWRSVALPGGDWQLCYRNEPKVRSFALMSSAAPRSLSMQAFIENGLYRIVPASTDPSAANCVTYVREGGTPTVATDVRVDGKSACQRWRVTRVDYDTYTIATDAIRGAALAWTCARERQTFGRGNDADTDETSFLVLQSLRCDETQLFRLVVCEPGSGGRLPTFQIRATATEAALAGVFAPGPRTAPSTIDNVNENIERLVCVIDDLTSDPSRERLGIPSSAGTTAAGKLFRFIAL